MKDFAEYLTEARGKIRDVAIVKNRNFVGRGIKKKMLVEFKRGEPARVYTAMPNLEGSKEESSKGVMVQSWKVDDYVVEDNVLYVIADIAKPDSVEEYDNTEFRKKFEDLPVLM